MRTEYTAIGVDANGNYITDPVCRDLDIRADGFVSVAAAEEGAAILFAMSDRVASVLIRESVQQLQGASWTAGSVVKRVER